MCGGYVGEKPPAVSGLAEAWMLSVFESDTSVEGAREPAKLDEGIRKGVRSVGGGLVSTRTSHGDPLCFAGGRSAALVHT
jgi:hypothetical protein